MWSKEKRAKYHKKWYELNKDKVAKYFKSWDTTNKEKRRVYRSSWRLRHPNYHNKYYKLHKDRIKETTKKNTNLIISMRLRTRINIALRGSTKHGHTLVLLDCSIAYLKQHIERQFKPGMSWNNYGLHGWHIDHIKPCSSFDLTKLEEQKKCFHYTNLQPLWAKDNLRKGKKQ